MLTLGLEGALQPATTLNSTYLNVCSPKHKGLISGQFNFIKFVSVPMGYIITQTRLQKNFLF